MITASERICLFLDKFPSYEEERDGIIELTQIGIAEAAGIARSNVPRVIHHLMDKGWIESTKVHIPGFKQKRFIYYLSPIGRIETDRIRGKLTDIQLQVMDLDGNISLETPESIKCSHLPDVPLDEILLNITSDGHLDCREFFKQRYGKTELAGKQVTKEKDGKHFHGRQAEIASIRQWLNSDKSHTLIIKGMPGIGKSTLLANAMDDISVNCSVHFFNINPWCTLRPLLQFLADSFAKIGIPDLISYLDEHPDVELYELEYLLSKTFSERKMLLIFDNFQNINADLKLFFKMLKKVIDETDGTRIVVVGRQVEPFYEISAAAIENNVLEITLEGLDETGTVSLARSFGIPEERMKSIMLRTGGHPLFIELMVLGNQSNSGMDIERFISEEFMPSLSAEEIEVLKFMSVFRFPVKRHALRSHQPALAILFRKFILKRSEDDFILLHDVLKDAFYRQLSESELIRFHSKAARYYLENTQMSSQMEAIHHFLCANLTENASEIMLAKADGLLKSGNMEFLARLLTILLSRDAGIKPGKKAMLMFIQGTALAFIGEMDPAIDNFHRSVELSTESNDYVWAKSNIGIASILLNQNNYKDSEVLFRKVLLWSRNNSNPEIEAEVNYQLGTIYERLGAPLQALKHFRNTRKISLRLNDKNQLAQASWGIGRIHHADSKFELSLKSKNEALDIALKNGNEHLASKIFTSIGWTLTELGMTEEAVEAHEKAISLSRKGKAARVLAYALSNAAAIYIDKPDYNKASGYLDEALLLFEKQGERRMIATVKLNMASIMALRGCPKEGIELFKEVKILLEAIDDHGKLMASHFKFGQAMKKCGQSAEALKLLKKALLISEELGNADASEEILREMQGLEVLH